MNSKKGISPVVATALLLVVSVISVVGFQGWFTSFSSSVLVDVESEISSTSSNVGVENLVGNKLYISAGDNLIISKIIIDGNECSNGPGNYSNIESINVSDCLSNVSTQSPEVVVVTGSKIITEYVYFENPTESISLSSSLDCSGLTGGDWITVSGNPTFGTSDFCVMKYEAKALNLSDNVSLDADGCDSMALNCAGGWSTGLAFFNPMSSPNATPWRHITHTDAIAECNDLDGGLGDYHLTTNDEWMTIARDIEQVNNNWVNSVGAVTSVGVGSLKQGNSGSGGVLGASYDGASNADRSIDLNTLGQLELSNGETIWDLSGNTREWINLIVNASTYYNGSAGWNDFFSPGSGNLPSNFKPLNSLLNTSFGVGSYIGSTSSLRYVSRGGAYDHGINAGIYTLDLGSSGTPHSTRGFRCVYTP